MKECLKYYKMPLHDYHPYILCDDRMMAFTWMCNLSSSAREEIVKKMNGIEIPKKFKHKFFLDDSRICFRDEEDNTIPIAIVRGWGHLIGSGGHNLPPRKAAEIQDEFAEYIVERLNK